MSKKVVIAADSTCDLSEEICEKYGIKVIPMHIVKNGEAFVDNVDITMKDVFDYAEQTGDLCKTSALSVGEYSDIFSEFAKEDCACVYFILSSQFSSTFNNALIASEDFEDIYPVDSMELSSGIGLLIIKACELRDEGKSAKEIYDYINQMRLRIDSSFVLDTLKFLHKGGRCSGVAALGANLLKLKPCIEVRNGKMDVGKKYRGALSPVHISYVKDRLNGVDYDKKRIFVTSSVVDDSHEYLVDNVVNYIKENYDFEEILITKAGCTIGVHCGPDTLGILFERKSNVSEPV